MSEASVVGIDTSGRGLYRLCAEVGKTGIPLCASRVSAGFPSPADDYLQDEIDLNAYLIRNPTATFLVRVKGDSMVGAHILDGGTCWWTGR
jgi:DNA polymerase V